MAIANVISSDKEQTTSEDNTIQDKVMLFSYPRTVESSEAHSSYMIFRAVAPLETTSRSDVSLKVKQVNFLKNPAATKSAAMIQLPMPNNMMENYAHDYSKSETTLLTDLANEYVTASGNGVLEKLSNAAGPALDRTFDRVQQSLLNNATTNQVTGQIHKQRGALLYGGTQLRTHNFVYHLRARNTAELKEIGNIIFEFRRLSAGRMSASALAGELSIGTIDSPPIWFIEERIKAQAKPRHIDKFMFGPAVITNVKVNKTPSQQYQTIANTAGDPVEIELELQFQEMIPVYEDYWHEVRAQSLA